MARNLAELMVAVCSAYNRINPVFFFFSSRRWHTRFSRDWSSDVCSSDLRYNVVLVGGAGAGRLESLTLQDRLSGAVETVPATAVFVLIGAEPRTQWLPDEV